MRQSFENHLRSFIFILVFEVLRRTTIIHRSEFFLKIKRTANPTFLLRKFCSHYFFDYQWREKQQFQLALSIF